MCKMVIWIPHRWIVTEGSKSQRKSVLGRKNNTCKIFEKGMCIVGFKN